MARQAVLFGMLFFGACVAGAVYSARSTFADAGRRRGGRHRGSVETADAARAAGSEPHPRAIRSGHHVDGQPIRCSRRAWGDDPHEPDGATWPHTTSTDLGLAGRHMDRRGACAVGSVGTILTSPDGSNVDLTQPGTDLKPGGRHMDRWRAVAVGRLARFSRARTSYVDLTQLGGLKPGGRHMDRW